MHTRFDASSSKTFLIRELATPEECRDWIALAEQRGFGEAPVTTVRGPVMMRHVRDNDRAMWDDPRFAALLYSRLEPVLPDAWTEIECEGSRWRSCGLNERLRFYRYGPSQRFATHRDGAFVRDEQERSMVTLLLLLSDDFEGGATRMLEPRCQEEHRVPAGDALCFWHWMLHEGASVTSGLKYVLRTDLMYHRITE